MKIETEPSGIEFLREIGYIVTAEDFIPIVGTGKQFFWSVEFFKSIILGSADFRTRLEM